MPPRARLSLPAARKRHHASHPDGMPAGPLRLPSCWCGAPAQPPARGRQKPAPHLLPGQAAAGAATPAVTMICTTWGTTPPEWRSPKATGQMKSAQWPSWGIHQARRSHGARSSYRLSLWKNRSGEADVQDKVPEPQVEYCAAGPVHDERQKDDGQDYGDHPEEEHDDAGDGIPGYSSRSSHGHQLPTAAWLIRQVLGKASMAVMKHS
jgi:hypothetical protein